VVELERGYLRQIVRALPSASSIASVNPFLMLLNFLLMIGAKDYLAASF
jgi:hypothetical protein